MQRLLNLSWLVLAEQDRWRELGAGFRGDRAKLDMHDVWIAIFALIAVVCGILILARITARQDTRRVFNSPSKLFRTLCAEHRLTAVERKLLQQLSRAAGGGQPAILFLTPSAFALREIPKSLRARAGEIAALSTKLFGDAAATIDANVEAHELIDLSAKIDATES